MRSENSDLRTSLIRRVQTHVSFLEEFMRDRSQINVMTDKHVDRFLTQSPVEQLFRELNQISFKTEKP